MKSTYYLILFCLLVLGISALPVSGQSLEVFAIGHQMQGDQTTAEEMTLKVNDAFVGGMGAGITVGKFNVNMDFLFGATDIESTENTLETKLFNFDINLDYRLFNFPIAPLVTAGFGSMTFSDSHYQLENFSETDFSYNYGAGLQANILNRFLLKGVYRTTVTKLKDTEDSIQFKGLFLVLGYIFTVRR